MKKSEATSGGTGLLTLLAVLFVGMKLTGHIDWSWWWVLAPIWGPIAIFAVIALCAGLIMGGRDIWGTRR